MRLKKSELEKIRAVAIWAIYKVCFDGTVDLPGKTYWGGLLHYTDQILLQIVHDGKIVHYQDKLAAEKILSKSWNTGEVPEHMIPIVKDRQVRAGAYWFDW